MKFLSGFFAGLFIYSIWGISLLIVVFSHNENNLALLPLITVVGGIIPFLLTEAFSNTIKRLVGFWAGFIVTIFATWIIAFFMSISKSGLI